MNRYPHSTQINSGLEGIEAGAVKAHELLRKEISKVQLNPRGIEESRLATLKILATTLLGQIESLEALLAGNSVAELNLQDEVHRFEAA